MTISSAIRSHSLHILLPLIAIAPVLSIFSGLAIAPLFILIVLLPFILGIKQQGVAVLYTTLPAKTFLLLLGWMLASSLWSIHTESTLSLWVGTASLFASTCMLISLTLSFNDKEKHQLSSFIFYGTVIGLLIFVVELIFDGTLTKIMRYDLLHQPEHHYFPHDMNRGATFVALMLWLALAALLRKSKIRAFLLWFVTVVIILQLESMAATVAVLTGSAVFCTVYFLKKNGVLLVMAGVLSVMASIPALISISSPQHIIASAPTLPLSAQHRLYIWKFVSKKSIEKPLVGYGLHTAHFIEKKLQDWPSPEIDPLPRHPHNIVMQIWLELGLIGLALYLLLVGALFHTIRKASWDRTSTALACSWLVSYLIISMTAYNGWQMWWVASGMLTAAIGLPLLRKDPPILGTS